MKGHSSLSLKPATGSDPTQRWGTSALSRKADREAIGASRRGDLHNAGATQFRDGAPPVADRLVACHARP
jgi:hypothetical protein